MEARLLAESPDGDAVRFAHALIREALYEGLLATAAAARAPAGGRGAGWRRPRPDPDAVAYHFRRAGDPRAAEWLVRAGERAQRAYAWLTAAERYEAALALLEAARRRRRASAAGCCCRWRSCAATPTRRGGIACLDEAARLAAAAGDRAAGRRAPASTQRAPALPDVGDDRGAGLARDGGGAAGAGGARPRPSARGLPALADPGAAGASQYHRGARWCCWLAHAGRLRRGAGARASARRRRGAGRRRPRAACATALGAGVTPAGWAARPRRGAAFARRARRLPRRRATTSRSPSALRLELALVALPYRADRPGGAAAAGGARRTRPARGRAAADAADARPRLPSPLLRCSEGAGTRRARWPGGTGARSPAARRGRDRRARPLARAQGDAGAGLGAGRDALPDGPGDRSRATRLPLARLRSSALAAALALDAGDLPTARAWLAAHDRWLAWSGAVLGRAEGQLGWAAYHRAAGDLGAGPRSTPSAPWRTPPSRASRSPSSPPTACSANSTPTAGRHAEAAAHLDAALALAEACAAPYERALDPARPGRAARRHRRRAPPPTPRWPRPAPSSNRWGRAPPSPAPTPSPRASPPRPPPRPAALPFGLTAREAEVLRCWPRG